ncbi:TnsA endonuclease N-terminal domain-containing protein [Oceanirhabdus sp. W0125-5]|uniref:TnsA endonuclease N-terminal domain-containing protein n=1 Tax=Oceanirhabdus sp. W0125-5 TaxID=2999116 RepID=UPI0022F334E5|nr:TnsA endonuclease N-terminal domain-containing protein [Oceanirhabdus sp. W0125-5]WBW98088.1 TnsA endonuclease N-terminal domain-containing protein [Oceanirhabdus sp. W0125-5]
MARQRKSDKQRLIERRGIGTCEEYKPWLKVHEFSSEGLASRVMGWKINRKYQLMSKLEREYFFLAQWEDNVVDIREQFPLLPIEETILIAKKLGYKHPTNRSINKEIVMTTDFVITLEKNNERYDIARTIKPSSKLTPRVKEKFLIEQEYWKRRNIDWGVITEKQIDKVKARNIEFLYQSFFWNKNIHITNNDLQKLISQFIFMLEVNQSDIKKTVSEFDILMNWEVGESLSFLKYLLAHKIVHTDLKKDITKLCNGSVKIWVE